MGKNRSVDVRLNRPFSIGHNVRRSMFGRRPLDKPTGGRDYNLDVSRLSDEVRRAGNISAAAPLRITNNAMGSTISIDMQSQFKCEYVQLQQSIKQNKKGNGYRWVWTGNSNDPDNNKWVLHDNNFAGYDADVDLIKDIQAPATFGPGDIAGQGGNYWAYWNSTCGDSGSGAWVVVMSPSHIWGKLKGGIGPNSYSDIDIWIWKDGSWIVDPDHNTATVYSSPLMGNYDYIPSGVMVAAGYDDLVISGAACATGGNY